jgi:hypothetical protein
MLSENLIFILIFETSEHYKFMTEGNCEEKKKDISLQMQKNVVLQSQNI